MKSIKFNRLTFATLTMAIVTTLLLFACQKADPPSSTKDIDVPTEQTEGKFKKQVTLKDASGNNWMILEVSANTAEELEVCPVEHFELTATSSTSDADIKPAMGTTAAETPNPPNPNSPHYFLNVIEEHKAPGVAHLSLHIKSVNDGSVNDRQWLGGGWYTSGVSNCGFGWRFMRNAGPAFYIYHYYSNNCQYPNIYLGYYPNRIYYSGGYFWGVKTRLSIYIPSGGDYTLQHGQFAAGSW